MWTMTEDVCSVHESEAFLDVPDALSCYCYEVRVRIIRVEGYLEEADKVRCGGPQFYFTTHAHFDDRVERGQP